MGLIIITLMIHTLVVFPNMVHKKQWKELVLVGFVSMMAVFLSVFLILNPDPPKIGTVIGRIIQSIFRLIGLGIPY